MGEGIEKPRKFKYCTEALQPRSKQGFSVNMFSCFIVAPSRAYAGQLPGLPGMRDFVDWLPLSAAIVPCFQDFTSYQLPYCLPFDSIP